MQGVLKVIDAIASVIAAIPLSCIVLVKMAFPKKKCFQTESKKMLVLDMSYTLDMVRTRQLYEAITTRDLNGYFSHVWSVHPCATIIPPEKEDDTYGGITITALTPEHTVVEGKVGRYRMLGALPIFNFLLAQWDIFRYLDRLIDREDITVVRAGDPYYLGPLGLVLSRIHRIPCVFRIALNYDTFFETTGHLAFPRLFRKRWIEKIIEHWTLKRADLVAGGNQDGLNFALRNGAREESSTVFRVGNLIHRAHFRAPNQRPTAGALLHELGLSGKMFSITISRFEPLKHVDDVIRCLSEVRKRGFDLAALLIGDGSMKEVLVDLAASLGVTEHVFFAGNRPQEWIASVLPRASVVISPFMGRALTEASLSGAPVAAYDIEWQAEIIRNGETGELIEYRNWKAMADAVERFLSDTQHARRVGENARNFTLQMMDPARLNRHERNEYDKLFARYFSS